MKKKILMLLALITLVTVPMSIVAQSPFKWTKIEKDVIPDNTPVEDTTTITTDTTTITTPIVEPVVKEVIPVYQKTWKTLEDQLKTEMKQDQEIDEVDQKDVKHAYEVKDIPTKKGKKTLFLCYLKSGGYFVSCENPNNQAILHSCYSAGILQGDGAAPEKRTDSYAPKTRRPGW